MNKETRYSPTKENGLGMLRLAVFCRSVRMAWLRRLMMSKSTWRELHMEEVGGHMFDPVNSTMDSLEEARKRMSNPVWKVTYVALLKCRQNILIVNSEEYATFPINGEPDLTANHCGIRQSHVALAMRGLWEWATG